ncbi:MAG: ATP-dependent helicase [Alphaproteobacteria bacterium]
MSQINSHSVLAPDFLEYLNEKQSLAVNTTRGPLLVLAGAGTGKTRVLTARLAHILKSGLVDHHQIMAVTFTNKAAREMRDRVEQLLSHPVTSLWLGTFHSLSLRILREHIEEVNLKPNFTILGDDDQKRLLKQVLKEQNIDSSFYSSYHLSFFINRSKDQGLLPEDMPKSEDPLLVRLYVAYQERLSFLNSVDFGDLILQVIKLFEKNPNVLDKYQTKFQYILVDEYQDTNTVQHRWLKLLSKKNQNICCVGDEDQSIYAWRGACIDNILNFKDDFDTAKIIRLEQNYRSTPHILSAASHLIAHNKGRLGKTLWTKDNTGDLIYVRGTFDTNDETRFINIEIEKFHKNGIQLNQIAILVRATFQTRALEERFLKTGLPYRIIGGIRFYERREIKDIIAYARFLVYPDDSISFERIINLPKRGIGESTLKNIYKIAYDENISLPKAAYEYACYAAKGKVASTLKAFFEFFDNYRRKLEKEHHASIVKKMLYESGYVHMWENVQKDESRIDNINEFIEALNDFTTLNAFLDHISLVMDHNKGTATFDGVTIMTLHAAKGLEFQVVFLPGWQEGLFPHPRAIQEDGGFGVEEERRLAYVGMTRARKKLIISYSYRHHSPQGWTQAFPSRFIKELPKEHIKIEDPVRSLKESNRAINYYNLMFF